MPMPLKRTPYSARLYLLSAALLLALPSVMNIYTRYADKFLVGTYKVERSKFFTESVIYISHHNGWGAVGLIINKPLSEKAIERLGDVPSDFNWHYGGPVMYPQMKYVLLEKKHKSIFEANTSLTLMSLHDFTERYPEEWQTIQSDEQSRKAFTIYVGYAGWSPLQLENELRRGSWTLTGYDRQLMFETPKNEIWEKAFNKALKNTPPNQDGT